MSLLPKDVADAIKMMSSLGPDLQEQMAGLREELRGVRGVLEEIAAHIEAISYSSPIAPSKNGKAKATTEG